MYSIFHKFYPLEKSILATITERSPENIKPLLLARIKEINLVQRHMDFKEINLYAMKGKKVVKNHSIHMPIDIEEYKYATLTMQIDNEIFKVDAWVVSGDLFSLTFNRSPKKYMKRLDIIMLDVRVNCPVPPIKTSPKTVGSISNKQSRDISPYHEPPLTKEALDFYLYQMETKLPDDYLNILSKYNGIVMGNWIVLGIDKVRHVVLQNGCYYVLAESADNKYLIVEDRKQDGKLFFTSHDSDDIVDMGNSLCLALEKITETKDIGAVKKVD